RHESSASWPTTIARPAGRLCAEPWRGIRPSVRRPNIRSEEMTDCGCEKAKAELEEYLHHELRSEEAADIAEHMRNCPDCSSEAEVGMVLTLAVQRACRETAPEDLREQVLLKLRQIQTH